MKCSACAYVGSALAIEDTAGKSLNVCPQCRTHLAPQKRPWEVLGIPKARYLATRPWKTAKMTRKAFEAILIHVSPEAVDALKREAEAEELMAAVGLWQDLD